MHIRVQPFWVWKAGNTKAEFDDAFCPRKPVCRQASCIRFAVADGATEAFYSGIWATQLVRAFCEGRLDVPVMEDCLLELQQRWSTNVDRLTTARRQPLPWYAEEKIRRGAFACILGLVLCDDLAKIDHQGRWQAIAVGDSCLVHMRGTEILARFPLDSSASFTNRPYLLSSNPDYNHRTLEYRLTTEGTWESGDVFYLMTDALACWFMKAVEEGQMPWTDLHDLGTDAQIKPFPDWVEALRASKAMHNDDVTLLRIFTA